MATRLAARVPLLCEQCLPAVSGWSIAAAVALFMATGLAARVPLLCEQGFFQPSGVSIADGRSDLPSRDRAPDDAGSVG